MKRRNFNHFIGSGERFLQIFILRRYEFPESRQQTEKSAQNIQNVHSDQSDGCNFPHIRLR